MDRRLVKAAIVVALGLTLLVPTFNALNSSYVKDVPPPPWIPTPPTPPDITPPSDFKPPPNMTPPTNFKGKVPPVCPPPVFKTIPEATANDSFSAQTSAGNDYRKSFSFALGNTTLAFGGNITWTNWEAQSIQATITGPPGFKSWTNQTSGSTGSLLFPATAQTTPWQYNSYDENNGQQPKAGSYTLTLTASLPIQGQVQIEFYKALACGGLTP